MNDEPLYYIRKSEFLERIHHLNMSLSLIQLKYTTRFKKEKNPEMKTWYQAQITEIAQDIQINAKLLKRAEIEEGNNLFWATSTGNMCSRRCTRGEYEEVYGKKKLPNYLI